MAKLTLGTLTSAYQAVTQLNANNALIEAAFENTLSRDGTTPNTMGAELDMNSNKVINLPYGTAASDAVNYQQVQDLLAAVATGSIGGIAATLVSIVDAGGLYTAIEVENALQEVMTAVNAVSALPVSVETGTFLVADGAGGWIESFPDTIVSSNLIVAGQFQANDSGDSIGIINIAGQGFLRHNNSHLNLQAAGGLASVIINQSPLSLFDSWLQIGEKEGGFAQVPYLSATGTVYVEDTAVQPDNRLMVVLANERYPIAGPDITPYHFFKVATTARSNDITLTDDPELSNIVLPPGQYMIDGVINWGQSGAGGGNGMQIRLNLSSGTLTRAEGSLIYANQVASPIGPSDFAVLSVNGSTRVITDNLIDVRRGHYMGYIDVNTEATIAVQWAQNVSNADNLTMSGGSWLRFTPVPAVTP